MSSRRRPSAGTRDRSFPTKDLGRRQSSVLLNMLPSCVRSRVLRVPSLRRASYDLYKSRRRSSFSSLSAQTPPPSYSSQTPSEGTESDLRKSSVASTDIDDMSIVSVGSFRARANSRSGILWNYGEQGGPSRDKLYQK